MNKLINLIKMAVITQASSDGEDYPKTQASYNGKPTSVTRLSPYGICSNPPVKSIGLLFQVQGREGTKLGIFDYMKMRFKNLKPGELQIGNYLTQASIKFDEDGNIVINCPDANVTVNAAMSVTITAGTEIELTAPSVTINASGGGVVNGNLQINGNISMTGTSTAQDHISNGKSFNTHVHGGVLAGGANTGVPV